MANRIESDGVADRRQALLVMGSTVRAAFAGPAGKTEDGALDEALRQMQAEEPRSKQGLSTHAPMAVEALCVLGFAGEVGPWLKNDRSPVRDLPAARTRIDRERWRAALGPKGGVASWEEANGRWGDWKEFFVAELAERPWKDVLDLWAARLAPGMSGAATHGVIRTAHAARALARRNTPERVGELARGLAYWASSYEELPARESKKARLDTFAKALDEVPLYRQAFGQSPEGRNIVEVLRHVKKLAGFADVRDMVAQPPDLSKALSALTATFARVYLRYGTRYDAIAFVHAVTGPCSLRRIAPHVSAKTASAAFPYAWQTAAAVFSAYVREREKPRPEESKFTAEELAARAVKSGDAHAIKFTEVMLAEHTLNPDPVYLAAAEDAVKRF